jgi:Glycosyl transferases group 1
MDIVYIAAGTWESILQRTQALAIELSRDNRVLYVNSVLHSVPGAVKRTLRRDDSSALGVRQVRENLFVLDLVPGLPGACHSDGINLVNVRWASFQLKHWLTKLKFRDYVLWIATPWAARLADYLDSSLLCYDCMDNIPAFFQSNRRLLIRKLEQSLIRRSDVVFASSDELYDSCRELNPRVYLVRNAVWPAAYEAVQPAAELRELPRPILGYVGYFGPWIDQPVLALLAERFSQSSIVIVGPVHSDVQRLARYKNIHFIGQKAHSDIPKYIQAFDVGLIPFVIDELATAVNPVKFYEYCAAGKPIVSSALPEMFRYSDICYLAASSSEFVRQAEQALAEVADDVRHRALVCRRRGVAQENSWEVRASCIREVLSDSFFANLGKATAVPRVVLHS